MRSQFWHSHARTLIPARADRVAVGMKSAEANCCQYRCPPGAGLTYAAGNSRPIIAQFMSAWQIFARRRMQGGSGGMELLRMGRSLTTFGTRFSSAAGAARAAAHCEELRRPQTSGDVGCAHGLCPRGLEGRQRARVNALCVRGGRSGARTEPCARGWARPPRGAGSDA